MSSLSYYPLVKEEEVCWTEKEGMLVNSVEEVITVKEEDEEEDAVFGEEKEAATVKEEEEEAFRMEKEEEEAITLKEEEDVIVKEEEEPFGEEEQNISEEEDVLGVKEEEVTEDLINTIFPSQLFSLIQPFHSGRFIWTWFVNTFNSRS
ncbi:X-linked retinitis pigmentosa GTPase regulator-interacting protein 1-like isoform X3 [Salvelinus fontinalis]|uniref:X-linked retinitis pigmentosa GTPase regulator-interacting protein 1-like isoform X3 n=1 Tax=Salvelinus fontinalis TaxID=8038 RepID=UPI0024867E43|nr:X-linked retinitis pigmentosa GTPase regulator-interacting protein 1-like isoform X3 [Salvelinus fontinalis]